MLNIKLYPNGYIGPIIPNETGGGRPPSTQYKLEVARATLDINVEKSSGELDYDTTLEELWLTYKADGSNLFKFEFRELILKKAVELLTINNQVDTLKRFFLLQIKYGNLTEQHLDAMKSIFEQAITGKGGVNIAIWGSIVKRAGLAKTRLSDAEVEKWVKVFDYIYVDSDIVDIYTLIQRWVSLPHGYEHLLSTLKLFYGKV